MQVPREGNPQGYVPDYLSPSNSPTSSPVKQKMAVFSPEGSPTKPLHNRVKRQLISSSKREDFFEKRRRTIAVPEEKPSVAPGKNGVDYRFVGDDLLTFVRWNGEECPLYVTDYSGEKAIKQTRCQGRLGNGKQHEAWLVGMKDGLKVVKTYLGKTGKDIGPVLQSDFKAIAEISGFLNEHQELKLRLPHIEFNVTSDAAWIQAAKIRGESNEKPMMVVEYVPNQAPYSWQGALSMNNVDAEDKRVLEAVREVIDVLWQEGYDIDDFKPDNVHWDGTKLVMIDYKLSDHADAHYNLNTSVKKWVQGTPCVEDFLLAHFSPAERQQLKASRPTDTE